MFYPNKSKLVPYKMDTIPKSNMVMTRFVRFLCLIILAGMFHPLLSQGKRLALVIGNSEYQNTGYLMNPVNDARDIGQALRNTGFEVVEYNNLGLVDMKKAIDQFGLKLLSYEIGLFYYAGHGIQAEGINYMVPVDATINTVNDVEYNCVDVGRMLAKMEDAGSKTNIVILDACRDNPFERSWSRSTSGTGLAFMNAPTGSLIAYATSPGTTASDGGGDNGLYTSAILRHIYEKDVSILQMFQKVRRDVREVSGGTQIPWETTSLEGDFYMVGEGVVVPAGPAVGKMPDVFFKESNRNNPSGSTTTSKSAVPFTPEYFDAHSRIKIGDSVFFNQYSSSGWTKGVVVKHKSGSYYIVEYLNNRGNSKTDVVNKPNMILSRDKKMLQSVSEINPNDQVYFFTSFDKIISYGQVTGINSSGIAIRSQYKSSGNHTVPLSAILVQE